MASYQYDSVRQEKELDDDHSTLADHDRAWHAETEPELRPRGRARRCVAALGAWRWLLDTTLLVVILVLAVERRSLLKAKDSHTYEFAGDLTGFAPTCRFLLFSFHPFIKLRQEVHLHRAMADSPQSHSRSSPSGRVSCMRRRT